MGYQVESHAASSTASRADFSNPRECRGVETGRGGKFSGAVPFLAVFWADEERAGDDGMAVVSGKWAQRAR